MCQRCNNKYAADPSTDTNGAYDPYSMEQTEPQDYDWSDPEGIVEPPQSLLNDMDQFVIKADPEAKVMNVFKPEIPGMMGYNVAKYDVSFDSFLYLSAFGYKYAQWQLSFYRGRILSDICDVYAGRFFTIPQLLDDARMHAAGGLTPGNNKPHNPYFPPAPIFAVSHVGCNCTLQCIAPRNVQEIPLTAPGLPSNTKNTQMIHQLKKNILVSLKDEFINRYTFIDVTTTNNQLLSMYMQQIPSVQEDLKNRQLTVDRSKDISEEAKKLNRNRQVRNWNRTQGYYEQPVPYLGGEVSPMANTEYQQNLMSQPTPRQDTAEHGMLGSEASPGFVIFKQGEFRENIKPVEVKESIMYQSEMGLLTPLPKGYSGFLLSEEDGLGLVYLLQLNHTILLPMDILKEVNLRVSKLDKKNLYGGMYVYVDDALGIAVNVYGTQDKIEKAMIYLPEFQQLIEVDDWRILERSFE